LDLAGGALACVCEERIRIALGILCSSTKSAFARSLWLLRVFAKSVFVLLFGSCVCLRRAHSYCSWDLACVCEERIRIALGIFFTIQEPTRIAPSACFIAPWILCLFPKSVLLTEKTRNEETVVAMTGKWVHWVNTFARQVVTFSCFHAP
jgi:hypothetical protein